MLHVHPIISLRTFDQHQAQRHRNLLRFFKTFQFLAHQTEQLEDMNRLIQELPLLNNRTLTQRQVSTLVLAMAVTSLTSTKVVLKKRIKAQISNSNNTKTIKIIKNIPSKTFLEFYLVHNCFCFKRLSSKLQNLRIDVFEQSWLKLAVFTIFDPLKKCFWAKFMFKRFF